MRKKEEGTTGRQGLARATRGSCRKGGETTQLLHRPLSPHRFLRLCASYTTMQQNSPSSCYPLTSYPTAPRPQVPPTPPCNDFAVALLSPPLLPYRSPPPPGAAYTTMQRDALARSYLLDALDTSVEAVNSAIAMLTRATPSAKLYQHIKVRKSREGWRVK